MPKQMRPKGAVSSERGAETGRARQQTAKWRYGRFCELTGVASDPFALGNIAPLGGVASKRGGFSPLVAGLGVV